MGLHFFDVAWKVRRFGQVTVVTELMQRGKQPSELSKPSKVQMKERQGVLAYKTIYPRT